MTRSPLGFTGHRHPVPTDGSACRGGSKDSPVTEQQTGVGKGSTQVQSPIIREWIREVQSGEDRANRGANHPIDSRNASSIEAVTPRNESYHREHHSRHGNCLRESPCVGNLKLDDRRCRGAKVMSGQICFVDSDTVISPQETKAELFDDVDRPG